MYLVLLTFRAIRLLLNQLAILQMKVQNFMKHNFKSLLNFVANEIVEYETENVSIILHCGTFIFVLLEKVPSQPYDKVLPPPPPRPSRTPHP
jgi:hypothetical protein